jgi:hypothetical protein
VPVARTIPVRWIYELTTKYDRSAGAILERVNGLVLYLDDRWSHLLGYDKDGVMSPPQLASYAAAIHAAGAPLDKYAARLCGSASRTPDTRNITP